MKTWILDRGIGRQGGGSLNKELDFALWKEEVEV